MGKLDQSNKLSLIDALMKGEKSADIQKRFNVSKQTVTTYRRNLNPQLESVPSIKLVSGANLPYGLEKEPREIAQIQSANEEPEKKEVDINQYYDPVTIGEHLDKVETVEDTKGHAKIPKSLLNETMKKFKDENKQTANKKSSKGKPVIQPDEPVIEEEIEDDKKELITRIRQYVFAFNDNKYLNEYIGKDKDKFVLALNKKSLKELSNILEYIQFHVRNKGGSDRFIETGITTLFLIIEKIGNKTGFELDGLTKEVADDLKDPTSDLKRAIIEISIEMDTAKYFNSPKVDLLLNLSQKLLFTHQKNKHLKALQPSNVIVNNAPIPKPSVEVFLKSGLDTELKNKYNDL